MENNNIKLKQLKFLDDTIKHFNSTNRGVDKEDGVCSYSDGCAIGRHLPKELCFRFDNYKLDQCVVSSHIFNELPEWLKELSPNFLAAVQTIVSVNNNKNSKNNSTFIYYLH